MTQDVGSVLVAALATHAEVRLFVQESNGLALIDDECTAGEVARTLARDVGVARGLTARPSTINLGRFPTSATPATRDSGKNVLKVET